ncbi:MAG TPA: KEOPS complex kinase/ATPase Bud32 [Candidatus Nitrosotenuis sp.]|nr:KEOPS complex kinase/ATPase Bud32 [Candidatus Nitrosotenuis sp.]
MKLLSKGAEGDLFLAKYHSIPAILKTRKKKPYRNSDLDNKIRRQRTVRESIMLCEAKSYGVSTPLVFQVDTNDCTILMQQIQGVMVRNLKGKKLVDACKKIGIITGTLHKNGIMHGDLTTSNFIKTKNAVFVFDFGLAQKTTKIEDHAVDLRLFKEILNSAHVEYMEQVWPAFLSGYKSAVGTQRFQRVLDYVSVIEGRGRYAQVV